MFGSDKIARSSANSSLDGAQERLLDSDSENGHITATHHTPRKRLSHIPVWAHGIFFLLYTALFLFLTLHAQSGSKSESHLPLPSREGLIWENRKFPTAIVDNPFTGEPRDELDEAWHELLKIKRMLFKEHYHKDKTGDAMAREEKHVDHCVEYIREALMCQPDLSMVTFRWINDTAQHSDNKSGFWPTNFDADRHRCANWEALDSWAGKRAFNLFEVDKLDRPMPE
ncbi:hypothetical protein MY11210_003196 [Beauveria gryllotalpidicola]